MPKKRWTLDQKKHHVAVWHTSRLTREQYCDLYDMDRSNWLFAGSVAAGERSARIMSLLETAKMNGLDPHAWLTDVLKRLPSWPEERLDELLPFPAYRFSE